MLQQTTKIKIAFYKGLSANGRDWQDELICKWTGGIYSHTEIVVGDYMYSTSPRDGSVRKKEHIIDLSTWDYKTIEIPNSRLKDLELFYDMTKGLPYDWAGIIGFIIPFTDKENKYFCSEWVTKSLMIMGVPQVFKVEPSKVSPNRLATILGVD